MLKGYLPTYLLNRQLFIRFKQNNDCVGKQRLRAMPMSSWVGDREGHAEVTGERWSACEIIRGGARRCRRLMSEESARGCPGLDGGGAGGAAAAAAECSGVARGAGGGRCCRGDARCCPHRAPVRRAPPTRVLFQLRKDDTSTTARRYVFITYVTFTAPRWRSAELRASDRLFPLEPVAQ